LALTLLTGTLGRAQDQTVDPTKALAEVQKKALSKGPHGEEPAPADSVSADNYGNGVVAAHLMAKFLKGEGQIGLVYHAAEGVMSAARSTGKDDLVITTCDLGQNVAIEMAQGGLVKGLRAQRPYDQGTTEALLAGYGLLNKPAPAYVAWPALAVTRDNLLEAWKEVYHQEAPANVKKSMSMK
jgi:ABC-type sugar transport system substrate-binding protein